VDERDLDLQCRLIPDRFGHGMAGWSVCHCRESLRLLDTNAGQKPVLRDGEPRGHLSGWVSER